MSQNKNLIRLQNLTTLKLYLFQKQTALKAEMAKETGLSVVTINALVKELVAEKIFLEGETIQPPLGRPAINYHFNNDQSHFLLLSIQEEPPYQTQNLKIVATIINLAGQLKEQKKATFEEVSLEKLLTYIQDFLKTPYSIERIGLSIPGKIYNGVVLSSWYERLNGWQIENDLKKITDIPISIQNDAHLMTVGYTKLQQLPQPQTLVGIFYPGYSLPGISLYADNHLIEGSRNLAGEAKYLPHLIDMKKPASKKEYLANLREILEIYNAVIAPDSFIISTEFVTEEEILALVQDSPILNQQINRPTFLFQQDFQTAIMAGLRWLVTAFSLYAY